MVLIVALAVMACKRESAAVAPVHTPTQALATFRLPPGYSIELVAAEPLVRDPVAIDFDADGRMYVVEMSGFMPNINGDGEQLPTGKIVVLEDTDDDGRMDRRTVFLDSLVLPRTVAVLEHGILVGAPPLLWLARDTTGDLRADTRVLVRSDYGSADGNPEHNANGARWGFDNWLHSANDTYELRLRVSRSVDDAAAGTTISGVNVTFESRRTSSLGQWGVSHDEYGRLYRNSNEDPLRTDLVPAHYATRSGVTSPLRGVYSALTGNVAVFPSRKTPAINRGYRAQTLRADSTLAHYTSAGSPTAYVGDRYPAAKRGSVFVTESAGNLVGEFVVDYTNGARITARRAQDSTDFLTSTDERFRPVNLASAPDGTLYVVDMYRGIIQHRRFITDYLEEKIRERGLEQPVGFGRIYRVVYDSAGRGPAPRISTMSAAQLVATLTHPNGWWRITAQRVLVERHDTASAPALRALLGHADDRVRLHALWTLEGLNALDLATVRLALADGSAHVRVAAIRVAEPFAAHADATVRAAMLAFLGDSALSVRRQLAASLVMFPEAERLTAANTVLDAAVTDGVSTELAARATGSRAASALARITTRISKRGAVRRTTRTALDSRSDSAAMEALAAQIGRTPNPTAVQQVLALVANSGRRRSERIALMTGLTRGASGSRDTIKLAARPNTLLALTRGRDSVFVTAAERLLQRVHWEGKPAPTHRALTPVEVARIAVGQGEFGTSFAACHQRDGTGLAGAAKSLAGSRYVNGAPAQLVRIVLQGSEGAMLMPPIGATMSDERVASILSFIRNEWGNRADPIDAAAVKEIRGATAGRKRAWTSEELARVR